MGGPLVLISRPFIKATRLTFVASTLGPKVTQTPVVPPSSHYQQQMKWANMCSQPHFCLRTSKRVECANIMFGTRVLCPHETQNIGKYEDLIV